MKKQTLLLLAGGMMAFASCNNSGNNQNPSQAQIDSMVNVKTGEMQANMQAKNDSTINALAKVKADSMTAATKNVAQPATVTTERREHHDGDRDRRDDRDKQNGQQQTPAQPTSKTKWNQGNSTTNPPNTNNQPTSQSKWGGAH